MGKGHLSLGTMILTVEPGRKREGGSIVSRNNDSNCRTRKREGRGHLSIGTMIVTVEPGRASRGHLSLGTIILGVERGGEVICL